MMSSTDNKVTNAREARVIGENLIEEFLKARPHALVSVWKSKGKHWYYRGMVSFSEEKLQYGELTKMTRDDIVTVQFDDEGVPMALTVGDQTKPKRRY